MSAHEHARRAGLPTAGRITGVITVVQEDRFRLEDDGGRGYLFIASSSSGIRGDQLAHWAGERHPLVVEYEGPPDLGAVAKRIYRLDQRRVA